MTINRSKEWWIARARSEGDMPVGAGVPDAQPAEDALVKYMVDRFLSWRLSEAFHPDGGISFKPAFNEHTAYPMKAEPTGTNLFSAEQATAMVRYMLDGFDPNRSPKKPTTRHSLERTSPKGERFVGTCTLCGTTGLTTANLNDECPNQRGLTQDEALVEAIDPTPAAAEARKATEAMAEASIAAVQPYMGSDLSPVEIEMIGLNAALRLLPAEARATKATEADLLEFLSQRYVLRAEDRQAAMGLSYLSAEVHELANSLARFLADALPPQEAKEAEAAILFEPDLAVLEELARRLKAYDYIWEKASVIRYTEALNNILKAQLK